MVNKLSILLILLYILEIIYTFAYYLIYNNMGKYRNITNEILELANKGMTATEIAKIFKTSRQVVYRKLKEIGVTIPNYHNALKFDNTVFDTIDTEEKAYWLGFLYADGYVSKNSNSVELSLKGSDIKHLEKFNTFIGNKVPVKLGISTCNGKIFSRCRCNVANKHFHNRLIELGCVPQKSLILRFPSLTIFSSVNLIRHFIRGYVDGDGCLSYTTTGRLVIQIIGTKEFLNKIISLYPMCFSDTKHKDKRHPNSNTYFISCSYAKADMFAKILYDNSNVYLDRKYERFAVLRRNS